MIRKAITLTDRDLEYRKMLGVDPDDDLPNKIGVIAARPESTIAPIRTRRIA